MKYAASTRPTVRKNCPVSWPCASGCRAMPLISALPAMPSPIPAPIAPPPRASPPPMRPPAVATACVMSFAAITSLPFEDGAWSVLFGGGEAEVQNCQERVDERLDRRDEAGVEDAPDEVADAVQREQVEREQPDHRQHDRAREDVAEESQRQRQRVDDLLEQQDEGADTDRLGPEPVRDVAAALPLDAEVGVEDDDPRRHGVDEVDVGRRRREALRMVAGWEPAQPVAEQDEEEQRDAERHHPARDVVTDSVADEVARLHDDGLDDDLCLVGHGARRLAGDPAEERERDDGRDDGRVHRVDVERHTEELEGVVLADRDVGGEHVAAADHGRTTFRSGAASRTISRTWKTRSPRKTVQPSGR